MCSPQITGHQLHFREQMELSGFSGEASTKQFLFPNHSMGLVYLPTCTPLNSAVSSRTFFRAVRHLRKTNQMQVETLKK